ncbi:MAG: carboxypeptidase-like regulatory domain-containing protein, partial [Polyangiales bacterium]
MRGRGTLGGFTLFVALATVAPVHAEEAESRPAEVRDAELRLTQNAFQGSTGGVRVIDASSGPKGTFRLALNTEFFLIRDYFVPSDRAQHFAGNLSFSVAAARFLEVFASAEVTSAWDNSTDPTLVQRVADVRLGLKGYHWIRPWVALGADASVLFPGGVGDMGDTFRATSVGLRVNSNLDFRARSKRQLPLILRFNAQYWFDNTRKLANGIDTPGPLIPFQRFAYNINEVDSVRIGAGLEAPLSAGRVGLRPLVEWQWDLPVNRQGFSCSAAELPVGDACLSDVGVKAFPMTLTLGLRILTPPEGLAVTVAADVGLTGTRDFARQLAPNSPYNIILGIGYAVDARRKSTPAPLAIPAVRRGATEGRVYGLVLDAESDAPVARALVAVVGDEASAQVSDEDGRFVTYPVPVGDVVFDVTHPDYQATQCAATFDATEASTVEVPLAEATCVLTPHTVDGSLRVRVVGKKGKSIPALAVVVRGPSEHRLVSDDTGHAAIDLQPGAY